MENVGICWSFRIYIFIFILKLDFYFLIFNLLLAMGIFFDFLVNCVKRNLAILAQISQSVYKHT
jgi:hypothetical protein